MKKCTCGKSSDYCSGKAIDCLNMLASFGHVEFSNEKEVNPAKKEPTNLYGENAENATTYLIYNNDKVNSILAAALRELNNEQLIALKEALVERTPVSENKYTKQDLIDLVQNIKDYTLESKNILGHDEREAIEFVDIFLNGITNTTNLSQQGA